MVYLKIMDIIFIENRADRNMIYTKRGQYRSPSRTFLKDHEASLLECGFVKPYKGILVNIREIQELQKTELLLTDGKRVPMSRNYQKDVMAALHQQLERSL